MNHAIALPGHIIRCLIGLTEVGRKIIGQKNWNGRSVWHHTVGVPPWELTGHPVFVCDSFFCPKIFLPTIKVRLHPGVTHKKSVRFICVLCVLCG